MRGNIRKARGFKRCQRGEKYKDELYCLSNLVEFKANNHSKLFNSTFVQLILVPRSSHQLPQTSKKRSPPTTTMKFLAALSILAVTVNAGMVTITNNCASTVYLKGDKQGFTASPVWINPGASTATPLVGFGNAWKLSYDPSAKDGIQFDGSIGTSDSQVYYDVSDVPGHPFDLFAVPVSGGRSVSCPGNCQKVEAAPANSDFYVKAC